MNMTIKMDKALELAKNYTSSIFGMSYTAPYSVQCIGVKILFDETENQYVINYSGACICVERYKVCEDRIMLMNDIEIDGSSKECIIGFIPNLGMDFNGWLSPADRDDYSTDMEGWDFLTSEMPEAFRLAVGAMKEE